MDTGAVEYTTTISMSGLSAGVKGALKISSEIKFNAGFM